MSSQTKEKITELFFRNSCSSEGEEKIAEDNIMIVVKARKGKKDRDGEEEYVEVEYDASEGG